VDNNYLLSLKVHFSNCRTLLLKLISLRVIFFRARLSTVYQKCLLVRTNVYHLFNIHELGFGTKRFVNGKLNENVAPLPLGLFSAHIFPP
jgi:hypothetical protein